MKQSQWLNYRQWEIFSSALSHSLLLVCGTLHDSFTATLLVSKKTISNHLYDCSMVMLMLVLFSDVVVDYITEYHTFCLAWRTYICLYNTWLDWLINRLIEYMLVSLEYTVLSLCVKRTHLSFYTVFYDSYTQTLKIFVALGLIVMKLRVWLCCFRQYDCLTGWQGVCCWLCTSGPTGKAKVKGKTPWHTGS